VKQGDLGEYDENGREVKYIIYMIKHQLPLKPRQITSSRSNQSMWMANTKFQTQEGSKKSTRFLNIKDHTPLEPRQIKPSIKFN
jgi:hypothetical protein